jgi:antirestriction protein ArdC
LNGVHESIHWSGAAHRINRDLKSRFDGAADAAEELVAELGAAFLCAHLRIANDPRPDHAAYLAHWLEILRHDKRALFTAASKAQAAADWLHARASVPSPELVSA